MEDIKLINKLQICRSNLINAIYIQTGRRSNICNNDILLEIARRKPTTLEELSSISGIGKVFIEKYGNYFVNEIIKYKEHHLSVATKFSEKSLDTLKSLQNKLINLSKRNSLLFLPKVRTRKHIDFANIGYDVLTKLVLTKSIVKVCSIDNIEDPLQSRLYSQLNAISKEISKEQKETGQNYLYLAYPFAIGKLINEDFEIRAPLVLFPIKIFKTFSDISLQIDDSRDVIYNQALLIALFKFSNINKPLDEIEFENYTETTLLNKAIEYYEAFGLKIDYSNSPYNKFESFREYSKEKFPYFKNGEIYLENSAVLGYFPIRDSSIQQDFDKMIDTKLFHEIINDLLESNQTSSDSEATDDVSSISSFVKTPRESSLVYINNLDSAQENVLSQIDEADALVIQGPPGTGKSQTIVSLIAKFALQNKKVALVSEKKTALDVVYSRLGKLSKFCLLIDDAENKDLFYKEFSKLFNQDKMEDNVQDIDYLDKEIDKKIGELELIAKKFYEYNESIGYPSYKLYNESDYIDFSKEENYIFESDLRKNLSISLNYIEFKDKKKICDEFNSYSNLDDLIAYRKLIVNYPFIKDIRHQMSSYDLININKNLEHLKALVDEYESVNLILKIFKKNNIKKYVNEHFNEAFVLSTKALTNLCINSFDGICESFRNYDLISATWQSYSVLTSLEQDYLDTLSNLNYINESSYSLNNKIYKHFSFDALQKIENSNSTVLKTMDSFEQVIKNIEKLINNKRELIKIKIAKILSDNIQNIKYSKAGKQIERQIEAKNKWAPTKFIKRFRYELLDNINIWLMTPEVVSQVMPLEKDLFDLVIFDEASQIYIEKTIPTIFRAKKVVIAGDHKQLRPTFQFSARIDANYDDEEENIAALEEESLLDLARFKVNDVLLNFHYRSKFEELIAFSNYAFYNGKLLISPNAIVPETPPIEVHYVSEGQWIDRRNYEEAFKIVQLIKQIFITRKYNETIGIITFNEEQRDLVDDLLEREARLDKQFQLQYDNELNREENGEDIGLFIKSIEHVQGDERDIIIFSTAFAKNISGRLIRNFGWLSQKGGENRLNVAITRAKRKIHIVTSFEPEDLRVDDLLNQGPKLFKKYLEYAWAISSKNTDHAKQILLSLVDNNFYDDNDIVTFDSVFENQIYDKLVERGLKVDTQVGIGGYRIDLAIKNENGYLLGIECDGKLYHSSKNARERDYHRQKYLESRGWKIYRIWSPKWWKNPDKEIDNIIQTLNEAKQK